MGSHANINAICDRFATVDKDGELEWNLRYCGINERMWGMQLFWMLLACFTMERTFFLDYESRLKFDDSLLKMRAEFENREERLRRDLILHYNVPPPTIRAASP